MKAGGSAPIRVGIRAWPGAMKAGGSAPIRAWLGELLR
jgi:hypothetical protein